MYKTRKKLCVSAGPPREFLGPRAKGNLGPLNCLLNAKDFI
jgi:hypothetical protein